MTPMTPWMLLGMLLGWATVAVMHPAAGPRAPLPGRSRPVSTATGTVWRTGSPAHRSRHGAAPPVRHGPDRLDHLRQGEAAARWRPRTRRVKRAPVRRPTVKLESCLAVRQEQPLIFAISAGSGEVKVRGGLSAGGTGWVVNAQVSRFRRTLRIWITARQDQQGGDGDVEDHDYLVTVGGLTPGRYRVRISHLYRPRREERVGSAIDVYEHHVVVT
jgi:hypothetical protein